MSKTTAIQFDDVRFCYDEVCAINNVTFSIEKNSITAIIGPNGGGKSTLVKILSGLLKPDEGSFLVADNFSIGYVSQFTDFDLSFPITVMGMVLSGTLCQNIKPFCKYKKEHKERARLAIKQVGLHGYEERGINQLSGGQLKRAVIARAIASEADIIVLDEPDSSLDVEAAADLYKILIDIKSDRTILIVSHHLDAVLNISDSVLYVKSTVTKYSSTEEIRKKLGDGIII